MKKIITLILAILSLALLIGCQVPEEAVTNEAVAETVPAVEQSSEEMEVDDALDEIEQLEADFEDDFGLDELEDLEFE